MVQPQTQAVATSAPQMISIEEWRFCIKAQLGAGSFGAVWAAESDEGHEVAIKEVVGRSKAELQRALAEVKLLRLLGNSRKMSRGISEPQTVVRVPTLVVSEVVETAANDSWRLRFAMTRIRGSPLEEVLEARRTLVADYELRYQCADACHFAGELLVQLAPTLERISSWVYHRDVSPRNILIDADVGSNLAQRQPNLHFGLVDFGLAVDGNQWRSDESSNDLAGDGRYWAASAWFVFGHGTRDLPRHPQLQREYRTCLDVHALGISALRCFMELTPGLTENGCISQPEIKDDVVLKLRVLRSAWQRYWSDARRFWQPIYDAFRGGNDFEALKAAYARAGVHRVISTDLMAIRAALSEARVACEQAPRETGFAGLPAFFDALLLMVRHGRESSVTLEEQPCAEQGSKAIEETSVASQPLSLLRKQQSEDFMTRCRHEDVSQCLSQSTCTPHSPGSSPSSTARMSPAESLVLLGPPPALKEEAFRSAEQPCPSAAVTMARASSAGATHGHMLRTFSSTGMRSSSRLSRHPARTERR